MSPTAQRHAVISFIQNRGDTSRPPFQTVEEVDRMFRNGRLSSDPMHSGDRVQDALALLNRGQRIAFQECLQRELKLAGPDRGGSVYPETLIFDCMTASPAVLVKVLLKVTGLWDDKL